MNDKNLKVKIFTSYCWIKGKVSCLMGTSLNIMKFRFKNGRLEKLVFARRVRRQGRWIYPKKAKVFRFWVAVDEKKQ